MERKTDVSLCCQNRKSSTLAEQQEMDNVGGGNHILRPRIVRRQTLHVDEVVVLSSPARRICVSGYAIAQTSIQRELGVNKTVSSLGITLFTVTFGVRPRFFHSNASIIAPNYRMTPRKRA